MAAAVAASQMSETERNFREREKNRRAQARFRERQKVKHGQTEKRMEELEAAVRDLQLQRDALSVKAEMLERCLHNEPQQDASEREAQQQKEERFQKFVEFYKKVIQELAPLLVRAQFDGGGDAHKAAALTWRRMVPQGIAMYQDEDLRMMVYSRPIVGPGEPQPEKPDKAMWRHITAALQMSQQQQDDCVAVRSAYLASMAAIMEERRKLNTLMQDMQIPDLDANANIALHTAKALSAMEALKVNVKREQTLQTELSTQVWTLLLTPIQAASATVAASPWLPDKLAILDAVAALASPGDASKTPSG